MMRVFNEEMDNALQKNPPLQTVKMLPTFVRALPDGSETGNFLVLDLGGKEFRVLLITLRGVHCSMMSEVCEIPDALMRGKGIQVKTIFAYCLILTLRVIILIKCAQQLD